MTYVSCFYHAFAGAEQVGGRRCCCPSWVCGPRNLTLAASSHLEVLAPPLGGNATVPSAYPQSLGNSGAEASGLEAPSSSKKMCSPTCLDPGFKGFTEEG